MGNSGRRTFLKKSASAMLVGIGAKLLPEKAMAFVAAASRKARRTFQSFAWGYNPSKILTISPAGSASTPVQIATKDWIRLSSWEFKNHAVTRTGELLAWGADPEGLGLMGNGSRATTVYSTPIVIGTDFKDVSSSPDATLAIKNDGTLWGWGRNYNDIFPTNSPSDAVSTPIFIASGPWLSLGINFWHSAVVRSDNFAFTWGINDQYELGIGDNGFRSSPTQLPTTIWKKIDIGYQHAMGIKTDGTLWGWGVRSAGALGDGFASGNISTPIKIGTATDWTAIGTGDTCSVMLKQSGATNTLWVAGDSTYGITGTAANCSTPVQLGTATDWTAIDICNTHALALKSDGTLWAWGRNHQGQLGINSATAKFSSPMLVGAATTWSKITAGSNHSLAIKDGELWAWGYNIYYQLGIGTNIRKSTPVRVGTDSNWATVSSGEYMTAAIKTDGTLWYWGYVFSFTNTLLYSTPVQMGTATDWADVQAGYNMVLVTKTNGDLYAFGTNTIGQLGTSCETMYSSPVQMGSETTWKRISVGHTNVVALKNDNSLWHWGWIIYEYGDRVSWYRSKTPVQLGTGTNWAEICAYGAALFAIKTDGTLWSWGTDQAMSGLPSNGGDGFSTPVQVGTASDWSYVTLSDSGTFVLKTNGTLWSWGVHQDGELGTPSTATRSSPVQIAGTWQKVSAGGFHVLALASNNNLYAWGNGYDGQLGSGNTSNVSTPIKIGTASNWVQVFAGKYSSYAKKIP